LTNPYHACLLCRRGGRCGRGGELSSRLSGAISHQPLDPVNPDILYGTTSSIWGRQHDSAVAEEAAGSQENLRRCRDTMIDVSNGERGQSTNFIDPEQIPKTIKITWSSPGSFFSRLNVTTGKSTWVSVRQGAQRRPVQESG
jgi:hypothetical protein